MKLCYRGVSYEYSPSKVESRKRGQPFKQVRGSGAAYNLIYRGVTYRIDPNAKQSEVPVQQVAYKLMYRGIAYFVNKTAQGKGTLVTQPANNSKVNLSEDKSLQDLNLLILWPHGSSDRSSTLKEEIQTATNEPIVQEEPSLTNKVVLFGVLMVFALLSAATWMQAPKIYQSMEEASKNSIEQLIFRYY
jgi:hypothetical protein